MRFCVELGLEKGDWQKHFFRYGKFFGEEMVGNLVKGSISVFLPWRIVQQSPSYHSQLKKAMLGAHSYLCLICNINSNKDFACTFFLCTWLSLIDQTLADRRSHFETAELHSRALDNMDKDKAHHSILWYISRKHGSGRKTFSPVHLVFGHCHHPALSIHSTTVVQVPVDQL